MKTGLPENLHHFLLSQIVLLAFAAAVQAEPVSINQNAGQGIAVSHGQNCYVLLPYHVHRRGSALSLSTGAPPVVGQARVFQTFHPGTDLSIAFVTGGLRDRCTRRFSDLPRSLNALIAPGGDVQLMTVSEAGHMSRVAARIATMAYEMMVISVPEQTAGSNIFKGRSGSVVLAGDTPVGLVTRALDSRRAEVLRMDAIALRVERLIANRTEPPENIPQDDGKRGRQGEYGLFGSAGNVIACSAEPVNPEQGCWTLSEARGPLRASPDSLPFVLELALTPERAVPVRQVRLFSEAEDDESSPPRTVLIERRAGTEDKPLWLFYGKADMSPFGDLDVSHGAAPRTRALRLTILDAWTPNLPIRLDRIEVH